jgi:hypothetical protein
MIILYEQEDLSVAIVNLSAETTIEDALLSIPKDVKHRVANYSDLPDQMMLSKFSKATRLNLTGNCISFDVPAVAEVTKNRLRKERQPLLEANDLLLRDAILENDEEKRIKGLQERDRLRNITKLADAAQTVEELMNISVDLS